MSIGFSAGILGCQTAAMLPSLEGVLGLLLGAAIGLLLAAVVAWLRRGTMAKILLLLATLAAGWGFAAWRAELRLADTLPMALEGQDVVVTGVVAGLPQDFERGATFHF